MIPTSLVQNTKILLPILYKWSFPFPFFLIRFPSQTTFPPPTSVVATLRSQLLPNQSWPGDTVMPVIRPDPKIFKLSFRRIGSPEAQIGKEAVTP